MTSPSTKPYVPAFKEICALCFASAPPQANRLVQHVDLASPVKKCIGYTHSEAIGGQVPGGALNLYRLLVMIHDILSSMIVNHYYLLLSTIKLVEISFFPVI